jgi:hypothetical protein
VVAFAWLAETEHRTRPAGQLIEGALPRGFVGPPSQEPCAVAEAVAGEMIVLDLDHQPRLQRFPFPGALRAPAAGSTRRIARESRRSDKLLETLGEGRLFLAGECGGEADVMKQAGLVIEAEQERPPRAGA